jgi:hypothetical protein
MTIATLIVDVLANTAQIQGDVDKINSKLDSVGGAANAVGGYLAKAFTLTAVAAAAKDVVDFAGRISDLSAKTGISVRELQRLEYAGNLVGVSLDQATMAVTQMQNRLAGGDKSAVGALAQLGLNLEDLMKLDPGAQFEAIAVEIAKIPDPATRTHIAMQLLGKTGAAVLPLLLTNLKETGDQAERFGGVMSDDVVAGGDELGDALSKLTTYGRAMISDFLKPALTLLPQMRKDLDALGLSAVQAAKVEPPKLFTASGVAQIKLTDQELGNITDTLNEQRKALDEAAEKAKRHADAIGDLRDQLNGNGAIRAARDMTEALRGTIPVSQLTEAAQKRINDAMLAAIEVFRLQGKVAPQAMRDLYIATMPVPPTLESLAAAISHIGEQAKITMPVLFDLPKPIDNTAEAFRLLKGQSSETLKLTIPEGTKQSKLGIDDLARAISQLSEISGGAFSGIAQAIGTVISAIDTAHKGLGGFKDGLKDWKAGSTWDGILGMTTGIMGITSAAITAVKAIVGLFNNHHGRDLVIDFADNLGGFDALHNALLKGGDAGEALWIKLTQGVGKNNPEQAKAVIAEVQRFLDTLGNTHVSPEIDPHVNWPDDMPGDPPDTDPGYAGGTPGLGFVNFGARKPTWLHGTEAVIPQGKVGDLAAQIAAAIGGGGGGDINITLDAGDLGKQMVKIARKDAATGGLRTRVTAGRSY